VLPAALQREEALGVVVAGRRGGAAVAGALPGVADQQPVQGGVEQVDDVEQLAHRGLRLAGLDLRQRAGADAEAAGHLAQGHPLPQPLGPQPAPEVQGRRAARGGGPDLVVFSGAHACSVQTGPPCSA
jgi:hypothetical protein